MNARTTPLESEVMFSVARLAFRAGFNRQRGAKLFTHTGQNSRPDAAAGVAYLEMVRLGASSDSPGLMEPLVPDAPGRNEGGADYPGAV
jgi:hypothetical protein